VKDRLLGLVPSRFNLIQGGNDPKDNEKNNIFSFPEIHEEVEDENEEDDENEDESKLGVESPNNRNRSKFERYKDKTKRIVPKKRKKKPRLQQASIFKVYDDCRQDSLTVQVIRLFKECFESVGLHLVLVPYPVISNRTGLDAAVGGIIHVVPDCQSRDQMGKAGAKTLLQAFTNRFGAADSSSFAKAQDNFSRSAAAYAVICYLLLIKDRHNGNLLIDSLGHLIHIDFGFILGISPGGNLGFETAAFKLTREMVEVLGGEESEAFHLFMERCVQGFLASRQLIEPVMALVASMADSE